MTDEEIERLKKRMNVFMQEGLPQDEAYDLATAMYHRDQDPQDDRRICFECKHYVGKVCMAITDVYGKRNRPLRFVLQRCDYFNLKGAK